MMETQEFIGRSHLDTRTLNAWVEAEWLVPVASNKSFQFSEADLARARLIGDLKADFGVNDEGIAIILHLLDQLYGLRCLVSYRIIGGLAVFTHERQAYRNSLGDEGCAAGSAILDRLQAAGRP